MVTLAVLHIFTACGIYQEFQHHLGVNHGLPTAIGDNSKAMVEVL